VCVFDVTYYKLHFQNLSTYHISHVSIGTLAAENLDVCTACDPWDINIHLTMGKVQRQQIYVGFVANIDIKILGVPPLGARHAFPRQLHMCRGGGWVCLFISVKVFFHLWCYPWMDDEVDGWMKSFTKNDHNILYYM
jgi:hypothetical protein